MNDQVLIFSIFTLLISSLDVVWRIKRQRLISAVGGFSLQFLLFFGIGGFFLALFPGSEPIFYSDQVRNYLSYIYPSFLLAALALLAFQFISFYTVRFENQKKAIKISSISSFAIFLYGLIGFALQNFTSGGLSNIGSYFSFLLYPAVYFAAVVLFGGTNASRSNQGNKWLSIFIITVAVLVGIVSPQRSVLISVFLAVGVAVAPRGMLKMILSAGLVLGVLLFVLPFQLEKRQSFEAFIKDPFETIQKTQETTLAERLETVGGFYVVRMSYVRESVYVQAALESDFEKWRGRTYSDALTQIVPRVLWPNKPALAHEAGYVVPRQIGLVYESDLHTSWAVNALSEAHYNFGHPWIPAIAFGIMIFLASVDWLFNKILRLRFQKELVSVCLFFFALSMVTMIFVVSQLVAILIVILSLKYAVDFSRKSLTRRDSSLGFARSDQIRSVPNSRGEKYPT